MLYIFPDEFVQTTPGPLIMPGCAGVSPPKTTVALAVAEQPFTLVTVTVYVPKVLVVIVWLDEPLDQL